MTVGHEPPLSRRQLRKNARDDAAAASASTSEPAAPDAEAVAPADDSVPDFRARDYRPDSRRPSFISVGSDVGAEWTVPVDSALVPQEQPASPNAVQPDVITDRPMTRRQLRALREQEEAAGRPAPHVVFPPTGAMPIADVAGVVEERIEPPAADEIPVSGTTATTDDANPRDEFPDGSDEMFDEFAIATAVEEPDAEVFAAEVVEDLDVVGEDAVEIERPPEGGAKAFEEPDAQPEAAGPAVDTDTDAPVPGTLSPFDALFLPPDPTLTQNEPLPASDESDTSRGIEPAPMATGPVFGHWSVQDDSGDDDSDEPTLSRNVGVTTGAITTHALVLPSIPQSGDQLLSPLTSTGEIMVTGSIDLPRSFGSTGVHPALFDHPDVDALIDEADRDDASAESAPVRAIRAVSSNTSTRGVIEAPTPTKSRLPIIAGITAGSVFLLGIGAVAAGFIFNLF